MKKITKKMSKKRKQGGSTNKKVILFVVAVLLLGGGVYAGINRVNNPQTGKAISEPSTTGTTGITSPNTIIYGVWAGNNSLIKAYNMEDKKNYTIVKLQQNIKRITAKMPDTLYFINNTNENDQGTEIAKYSISGKQQTTLVKAEEGYGIDDYFISPDGNYATTWEIHVNKGKTVLYGGKSRVYSVNLNNPAVKNLLYDEVANKPIHYPRGIMNNGTVITDMFLPNSGPGWAYGMSSSDFGGLNKKDIISMVNGTYGRQPRMSYDGNQVAFAGYNGIFGSGTEQLKSIRRALIEPNTSGA